MEMTCHPRLGGAAAGEAKLRGSSELTIYFYFAYRAYKKSSRIGEKPSMITPGSMQ